LDKEKKIWRNGKIRRGFKYLVNYIKKEYKKPKEKPDQLWKYGLILAIFY